jgi:hypothetical protein
MHKNIVVRKGLVVGIIFLFIGVCIHPAIAVENKSPIINNQSEEDCGCEVGNTSNQVSSFICDILDIIFNNMQKMCDYFHEKANESWEAGYEILEIFYLSLLLLCVGISMNIWHIGINLGCWEYS